MSGCFGTSIFDRNMEYALDRYLDSQEDRYCYECGCMEPFETWGYNPDEDTIICPCCGEEIARPDDLISNTE